MRPPTINFQHTALTFKNHFVVRVAALGVISFVIVALFFANKSAADNRTWDGGGATNNWSEAANWSGDTVPGAGDVASFDGTSTKDATIDAAGPQGANISVQGIQISAGYTGAITQAPGVNLTVGVSGYSQSAGTFISGSGNITFNAAFMQSGGAFQGTTGNLDFNSSFTLSGGTFTASSTTTSFAVNFTQTGGTFAPNDGTVVFDSGSNTFLDVPTSLTLNHVTVNKAGAAALALQAGGDTLIVAGTLALTDGVVNGAGGATLEAQGDVSIASTFNGGNAGFPITLLISGAATRTVTLPAGVPLPGLTINASNVTVNTSGAGAITFTQALTIQSVALFTNGTVDFIFNLTFTQSGGTFTGGSGLIDFNNTFTLSGGTFTASSTTSSFATNFTQTGGTFAPNGGTVVFDSSSNTFLDVPTSLTLNNVTVNKAGLAALQLRAGGDSLIVAGTLALTDGRVNGAGGATLEAQGDVSIASTFSGGIADFPITLLISGAATRTVTLPAGVPLPALTVNAPNVTVNTSGAGAITFTQPVSIQSVALFTNGTVDFIFSVPYTHAAATFTGGSGLIDFNNTFTLSGGTFTASSNTTSFAANLTQTGGTFVPNGGTVVFDSFDNTFLDVPTSLTLNHVTVNKAGLAALSLQAGGDTLIVAGTLALTDGFVNGAGGATLEAQGDVSIASTFSGGNTSFPITLLFAGAANQTYTNAGAPNPAGSWAINKPSGTVTAATNLILGTSQPFSITSGTFYLNNNSNLTSGALTIGTNGRLVNDSSTTITLGGNLINNGLIDLQGGGAACPEADSILLRSSVNGTRRNWSGTGTFRLVDVDVKDMGGTNATTPLIEVFSGTNSGNNNANWIFNNNCPTALSITPSVVNVAITGSQTFAAGGGFRPYTFSLLTNNSGGSINASNGQYTAGSIPNVTDTVRVTDVFGDTADATVNVTTGPPTQLAFSTQPTTTTAGEQFDPVVQVAVQDQFGNTVPNATNAITLSTQNNPCFGFISGQATRNAVNGIATFNGISIGRACNDYTLRATASSLTSATSNSFNINVGPAAILIFITQPSNTNVSATITPAVEIGVEDSFGNRVTTANNPITVALEDNPGVLSGRLTRNPVNGLATFDDLSLNRVADNYTLVAASDGLISSSSNAFNITRPTFMVTNTNDDGAGSLRQAIIDANNLNGADTINFNIPGVAPYTITLNSALSPITESVVIDANTQPNFSGTPIVELSGANVPSGSSVGLLLSGGSSTVRGLVINRFDTQIQISGSGGNVVQGNYLGTDVSGNTRLGSLFDRAILISSDNNLIGGSEFTTQFVRNVIVGRSAGVEIQSGNGNRIQGNYIGTNAGGTAGFTPTPITGVFVRGGANNVVGGEFQGEGNVVSGNSTGIDLRSPNGNLVQGNFIGTTADGVSALGNFTGITVLSPNNTIGGPGSARTNLIAGNTESGILLLPAGSSTTIESNVIGGRDAFRPLPNGIGVTIHSNNNQITDNEIAFNTGKGVAIRAFGNITPTGNAILANLSSGPSDRRIHSNGGLGISLTNGTNRLPNDPGDADTGPNNRQNYPVLTLATSGGGNTNIQGTLNSTASSSFTLHFYSNQACDPSFFGEGQTFLGTTNVTTGASNIVGFSSTFPINVPVGQFITATVTDAGNNTSEFSQCLAVAPSAISISGRLTDNRNEPLKSATVNLTGTQTLRVLTDSLGNYAFRSLSGGGNYTVTPVVSNLVFTPPNRVYTNVVTNQSNQDFVGTINSFSISGIVRSNVQGALQPLAGVTVTLSGAANLTATTNTNGDYSFGRLQAGSYTVTPARQGFSFTPASTNITLTNSNATANFTAQSLLSQLSGRITLTANGSLQGMNADGSSLVTLLGPSNARAAISPDGRKIVFQRLVGAAPSAVELFAANYDGSNLVRLTNNSVDDLDPVWSPDAAKIAFTRRRNASFKAELFTMNADGTNQARVPFAGNGVGVVESPSWSPDGTRIAFTFRNPSRQIWTVSFDGSNLTVLTNDGAAPDWSPDGTRIIFIRTGGVFTMNADGTSQTQVIADNVALSGAAWSPDGSRFVYSRFFSPSVGEIRVADADGSNQVVLANFFASTDWSIDPSATTPTGSNVSVQLGGTSLTFSGVGMAGETTVTPIPPASAGTLPGGFVLGNLAFEVNTTASVTPPITVCFTVPTTTAATQTAFNSLSVMHNEGGMLVDRTTSRTFATRRICASVNSLSPFVLAEQVNTGLPSITGLVVDASGSPLSNVAVNLTGTETLATTTDSDGVFNFVNLTAGGNYNVQPKQVGFLFREPNLDFVALNDEQTVVFAGTAADFSVSGKVTDANGSGIPGVEVSLEGAPLEITDVNGDYAFTNVPAGGDYFVTPLKAAFVFTPGETIIQNLSGNQTAINFTGAPSGPTAAPANISGRVTTADGTPLAGTLLTLTGGSRVRRAITNSAGEYVFEDVETDNFYIVSAMHVNYVFAPSEHSFSLLANNREAVFTAHPLPATANPIDTPEFFVRQNYLDFLGREPEQGGLDYWSRELRSCGTNELCFRARRIGVSAAFFVEQEFQRTGSFLYGLYKGSLGRQPLYAEFSADRQQVVEGPNLDATKETFVESFVARPEFVSRYQANISAESFVDALLHTVRQTSGVELAGERANFTALYASGANVVESRSRVVRAISENAAFREAEYNKAFVLAEYFGYLRRDPDPGGYEFWLDVLNNREPGNYRGMVCAFIASEEYQRRFSSIVTTSDRECGP